VDYSCAPSKKISESRAEVKRCFQDQSCIEDRTGQRKMMLSDVEFDGPQAIEMPLECTSELMSESEFLPSQNTQTIDLETHMGCLLPISDNFDPEFDLQTLVSCLPASNNDFASEFYALYGYLPLPSPDAGHLPLGTWMDFCDY
jgi:hypothetical protein